MTAIKSPKKLIEVALPLDAINEEASLRKRKAPGGYPPTLHKWWAQRPVAAARAVIFAQMVNDPGYQAGEGFKYGVNKEKAAIERARLFKLIEDLVLWENTNNEAVLAKARKEIWRSWRETCELNKNHPQAAELFNPDKLPAFHDPFAGSGALPLEAQRLGLEAYASDLNPVAVTINKAMVEIPPKFVGRAPVGPRLKGESQSSLHEEWTGAKGLAEDVRRYGAWMREEAQRRIGHLYPKIEVTAAMAAERPDLKPLIGHKLTVIAWLWARTVKSPNPAFSHAEVPLISTFVLSSKAGKEAYVEPLVTGHSYKFSVKAGPLPEWAADGTKASGRGANFRCLLSDTPIGGGYIKAEGQAGRMGARLMVIVAEGLRGRVYLAPTEEHEAISQQAQPTWKPAGEVPARLTGGTCVPYGLKEWGDLFTPRQLVALTTFSDLVAKTIAKVRQDALAAGMPDDGKGLDDGGGEATAYAQAVGVYIACAISRCSDYGCSLATWRPKDNAMRSGMPKQALQMSWDFAEGSPFGGSSSDFLSCCKVISKVIEIALTGKVNGCAFQHSAAALFPDVVNSAIISTDPPYYDNISYADLSDFLYVWLRRSIRQIYPSIFATVAVPKSEELVATEYRHGGKAAAKEFFISGMTDALKSIARRTNPAFPVTIYYAFKQSETSDDEGTFSTGWETFLQAVVDSGLSVTGTWPMRTEGDNRQIGNKANALSSSIVLVCRQKPNTASTVSRREFLRELNAVLPEALDEMTQGGVNSPVQPVDLSQAIIGPGMGIFSQYAAVLEADGTPMSVKTALQLINRFLAEDDFEHDTQFCLLWFEKQGWAVGQYGEAEVLARAKGTSVGGLVQAGVAESGGGDLRLLKWSELPRDWSPETDTRIPIWEALHHLIRALNQGDSTDAGRLLARMAEKAEPIRALAYRLHTLCERKGWSEDARAYNELVTAWTGIETAAADTGHGKQKSLFD